MLELQGKYNTAKVFTDEVESSAMAQIIELCCQSFVQDSVIRIMPDCHAGAGCTIGTTMTLNGKVCPNGCGVDIGCGVLVADIGTKDVDLEKLDAAIRQYVPSGFNVHNNPFRNDHIERQLDELYCKEFVNFDRALASVGTLGGGWAEAIATV